MIEEVVGGIKGQRGDKVKDKDRCAASSKRQKKRRIGTPS
jgi:hypothetical protein